MTPIVDPIWFYIINSVSSLRDVLSTLITIGIIMLIISVMVIPLSSSFFDIDMKLVTKVAKKSLIFYACITCLYVVVPNENTMYKMLVASYITENNVEIAKEEVKDLIDYISEKFKGE